MKLIVQRVLNANVRVNEKEISSIGRGFMVLVGIENGDTEKEADFLSKKMLNLRLWPEETNPTNPDKSPRPWRRSVMDIDGQVLCVSQFTLLARTNKGTKPDFHQAMSGAKPLYEYFLDQCRKQFPSKNDSIKIQDGAFGEYMQVSLTNDGPVTIPLEKKADTNN